MKTFEEWSIVNLPQEGACTETAKFYARKVWEEKETLKKALEDLYMQSYGIKNNWCGMWINCSECGHMYASGGNWNDGESCPFCEAKKLINY